jgi:lactoylglutathione lyase
VQIGTGFSHLVVQVHELAATIATLSQRGLKPEPEQHPAGPDGRQTSSLTDPDGYRIELVPWPHPDYACQAAAQTTPWPMIVRRIVSLMGA